MSASLSHSSPRVLIVCLGNICRSPSAEAVFRKRAEDAGLAIEVDSAGTYGGHAGARPDARAQAAGERRGYDFSNIYARQITASDFSYFSHILAADKQNLADLSAICPAEHRHKIALLLSKSEGGEGQEVPDPYYGTEQGFEQVLDLVESACDAWLADVR
ncbi:low molecular weight protein-tyrosine-phosphatase [Oceanisphaera avium]|uniref:protein-tyrosine-phosphatase n=1 Tax=Oceanisphaera avium TaxID=1903694 RepID=A0A1Y0CWU6_9GAMM|nr:low molecular weight protein-tyrosine-phosphatase [Oceanisphaera avium]ART79367.1 protein-tyrosine-phosphatase [Oceanisphaera avium]